MKKPNKSYTHDQDIGLQCGFSGDQVSSHPEAKCGHRSRKCRDGMFFRYILLIFLINSVNF